MYLRLHDWHAQVSQHLGVLWRNGGLFLLLAGLALIPVWFKPHLPLKSLVQDTLFVIDVSESMNVRDVDYPRPRTARLTLAKLAVQEAMSSLPCGSKVSIGLFAGDEIVVLFEPLEICEHYPAIEQVVHRLDTHMRWVGDSWVIRAIVSMIKQAQTRQLNVVMLSDYDEMPHHSAPRLTELIDYKGKVKGVLIGVGNPTPQPVPRLDGNQQITGYWTPEEAVLEGNHPNLLAYVKALAPNEKAPIGMLDEVGEHLSAFQQALMQSSAEAVGFAYGHIQTPTQATRLLTQTNLKKEALAQRDARWILGLLAAAFLLLAWFWQPIYTRLWGQLKP